MRKLCELIIFLTSLFHHHPAQAQIATLTGNVNNINTVGQAGGIRVMQVIYELHSLGAGGVDQLGCGTGILPRITGSGVALATTQWPYTPSGTGAMSGSIYRNDFIDCAGVTPTFYKVYMVNAGSKSLFGSFKIDSTTVVSGNFNFTTATGLTGASFTTAVGSTVGAVLLNPVGDQTITVGSLFMSNSKVLGWNDAAFSRDSAGVIDCGNGTPLDKSCWIQASKFAASNNAAIIDSSGLTIGSPTGLGSALFKPLGVATAGNNLPSIQITWQSSVWNGSSALTDSWTQQVQYATGGTNGPTTMLFTAPTRYNDDGSGHGSYFDIRHDQAPATAILNTSPPMFRFFGNYWTGSSSTTDAWRVGATYGSGANPTSTFQFLHSGTSGLASVQIPILQITNLGSTATPSIVWTGNGLTNWGLNQDFGTGELVTVENGVNVAQLGHQMTVQAAGEFSWVSGTNASSLGWDTTLYRDSAGIVGVGAGTHTPVGSFKASHIYAMTGGSFNGTFADDPTSPTYILGHVGGSASTLKMANGFQLGFVSSVNASTGTVDSCLARAGVGVVKLTSDCGGGTPVNTALLVGRYLLGNENITLANGLNSNIQTATSPNDSYYEFTGPTAAFSIGGFVPNASGFKSGQLLQVFNDTAQQMTIVNLDASSTAGNRILTLTGANVVLRTGNSFASFIYSPIQGAWLLTSSN